MNKETIQNLIEDLYNVKDKTHKEFKESVQLTIDLLDELQMEGSLYLYEE
jgi:hypothetical protein